VCGCARHTLERQTSLPGHARGGAIQQAKETAVAKRILVVDDDHVVLLVLESALARLGPEYEIMTAEDGQEALQALSEDHYDLLVTDLSLPGLSGIELTEALRKRNSNMSVIWITAYGCHNVCSELDSLGVCCCLDKPVEISEIRDTVRRAMGEF
jgi:DNA-binding NtrC family response regulator